MMDEALGYLLDFLRDDLGDIPDIRIHPVLPSGTMRSPDLPQDYDAENETVHKLCGVRIRRDSREYFFPVQWVKEGNFKKVQEEAQTVREECMYSGPLD